MLKQSLRTHAPRSTRIVLGGAFAGICSILVLVLACKGGGGGHNVVGGPSRPGQSTPGLNIHPEAPEVAVTGTPEELAQAARLARAAAEAEAQAQGAVATEVARAGAEAAARASGATPAQIAAAGAEAVRQKRAEAAESLHRARANSATPAGIQANHQAALHQLAENLARNQSFGGAFNGATYNLTTEYHRAHRVLEAHARQHQQDPGWHINTGYLIADPFLALHNEDIHALIPEEVTDAEFGHILTTLANTRTVPEVNQLTYPFNICDAARADIKKVVRKRIKRLFHEAEDRTLRGEPADQAIFRNSQVTPLGELAFDISQNYRRCIDGLQDGLAAIEERMFAGGGGGGAAHMGEFISQVLADYRMDFIKLHASLDPLDNEFPTMVVALLKQKMLYSLGLRGRFTPLRYGGYGQSDDPLFQSDVVMRRFLNGGRASLRPGVQVDFPAYNVDKLISLLDEATERGFQNAAGTFPLHPERSGLRLAYRFIKAECVDEAYTPRDPVLGPAWNEFEAENMLETGNAYFQPAQAGQFVNNIRPTRAFWLHELEKYGYISRRAGAH
jgi:hypothetical protein